MLNLPHMTEILDHWDMWSSRNWIGGLIADWKILDHWDMWSSRNFGFGLHAHH